MRLVPVEMLLVATDLGGGRQKRLLHGREKLVVKRPGPTRCREFRDPDHIHEKKTSTLVSLFFNFCVSRSW